MTEQERLALIKHCEMVRDGETFFDSIAEFNKRHQQLNEIALSALQDKLAVPDGWNLVTIEATPDMLNASWAHHGIYHPSAYRTMVAAAPMLGGELD